MAKIAQHSSETNEHYTPSEFIEAAREVMGSIDLDPASSQDVNQNLVKANRFFSKEDDGLTKEWASTSVWLNPPGGILIPPGSKSKRGRSNSLLWWSKLTEEYLKGNVKEAIFLAFNMELLRSSQNSPSPIAASEFSLCFPMKRIRFLKEKTFEEQSQPTHANVLIYLPPFNQIDKNFKFKEVFSKFGAVKI